MGLYTFITYLTQHIPDKYFRNVRGYGIFSNRLKGSLLGINERERIPVKPFQLS